MITAALIAAELAIILAGGIAVAVIGTCGDRLNRADRDLAEIDAWLTQITHPTPTPAPPRNRCPHCLQPLR